MKQIGNKQTINNNQIMMTGFKKNKAKKGKREIWVKIISNKVVRKSVTQKTTLEDIEEISHANLFKKRTFQTG